MPPRQSRNSIAGAFNPMCTPFAAATLACEPENFSMAGTLCPSLSPTLLQIECLDFRLSGLSSSSAVGGRGYLRSWVRALVSPRSLVVCNALHSGRGRWAVGTGTCITRQGLAAGAWSDRIRQMKSRRVADPIRAMGEDTMWITASSAVGLVLSLAAVAALGGYLLSMGVDNAELSEEEKIESLKQQGLYEKPEPTQYEEQGVVTRTRKRRSSKD
ncbi:uncharacterized protein [Physcomitrium patens]|uniref:Uncharacterized protein n=1 Tax=Physcomitrium patens TaxID=3218 RepID=A0A7I4DPX4_PHYPA|nr:uncharacterized protein LOC112282585 isoform X2 [Physcomitrium patens]|eukprot:XP_024376135.1 uncharacterized protein LOC112282585 isoform X2 [Physcomitrella patens]